MAAPDPRGAASREDVEPPGAGPARGLAPRPAPVPQGGPAAAPGERAAPERRGRPGARGEGVVIIPIAIPRWTRGDRKSTRLNSSHVAISYAVFCLKK